jgi:hypothetical protein
LGKIFFAQIITRKMIATMLSRDSDSPMRKHPFNMRWSFVNIPCLAEQHVESHNFSMVHAPQYSEIDAWNSPRNEDHLHEKNILLENLSQISTEDTQYFNNINSLDPPSANFFITTIFMEAACEQGSKKKTSTSSRRCLIDTGADVNMITLNSLEGLQCSVQPFSGCVHGAGGRAEVVAIAKLNWHLKSRFAPAVVGGADSLDDFVVVDPTTPYSFDCVLGRPWIQKHILFFTWLCLKQRFLTNNGRKM